MPRPVVTEITFEIDGREVRAPENAMLVDAAKFGDVDIPVFCYEPKLGAPVGACRMCLVEIEGIPKLQTACSTPVKDGMVVHTTTDRVKEAQNAVVEFLLVNHPLDCPVCDKGGECPLQDISYGWGRGISRFVEPKRHFEKPVSLSPLIAIDRERCILCYRCVRFSQELSEDHQLVLHERGADTFVGTFDGHPYVAPFSGNIIELCPVGALTSKPYRFRARPWDIEQSGSVCSLCPGQCNVSFTVRDDRVLRVLSRQNDDVDDGWLCDRGRFSYQAIHVDERVTEPLLRDGGGLRPVSWERAMTEAVRILGRTDGAALAGRGTTNEEGFLLQRLHRDVLGNHDLDSRLAGALPASLQAALDAPEAQATMVDVEWAHAVLLLDVEPIDDMPVLDLRIRKGLRRHGLRLAVATSRPSSLDPTAEATVRFAPGAGEAFVRALDAAVGGVGDIDELAAAAGADPGAVTALGTMLREAGEDVVVVWGERLTDGTPAVRRLRAGGAAAAPADADASRREAATGDGAVAGGRDADPDADPHAASANAARGLLKLAGRLGLLAGREGAGLLQVPSSGNGRGLREVGVVPTAGPGHADPEQVGRTAHEIAEAAVAGDVDVLHLLHVDPMRTHPDRELWDRALHAASGVVAHADLLTAGLAEHATVVFPADVSAEKEGTITHPDGRVQRMRPAIAKQGAVRPGWQVLSQLIGALGGDVPSLTSMMVTSELAEAVPFYGGITHDEIGGAGVRWQDRPEADAYPAGERGPFSLAPAGPLPEVLEGGIRIGRFSSIWAAPEVEASPALRFLTPRQRLELHPVDAERLGLRHGAVARLRTPPAAGEDAAGTGPSIEAVVHLRDAVPPGTGFVEAGIAEQSGGALVGAVALVEPVRSPSAPPEAPVAEAAP